MLRLLESVSSLEGDVDVSLEGEIKALREALELARQGMRGDQVTGEMAKMGALVARLSDSLVRALLAQQKLSAGNDKTARLLADLDHVLRVMGET